MKQVYSNFLARNISWALRATFLVTALAAGTSANAQVTYTFTNAGANGRFGPTQTQVNNAYTGSSLQGLVTVNGGLQSMTLPAGVYRIQAWGAQGGSNGFYTGGLGSSVRGEFTLTAATAINVLVGQQGEALTTGYNAGGGGGSFVWVTGASQPLVAAAGGGGAGASTNGVNGATTTAGTAGTGASGTAGTGGNGATPGGGGWLSAGGNFQGNGSCSVKCTGNVTDLVVGGASPTTAIGYHGCSGTSDTGDGGFGGGSGGSGLCSSSYGAGGGGGYSGGVGQSGTSAGGGGGGSYNGGGNQLNAAGTNTGNGRVVIEDICPMTVSGAATNSLQPAICNGNSIILTSNATSNFVWSTGAVTNTISVSPNVTTVYSVSATTSLNCTAVRFITVTVNSGLPVLSISNPSNNICLGRTATLTATGAITHTWTGGVINAQTFTPTTTQVYTVTGTNGCGFSTATTTVTVAPLPVTTTASPAIVCQGYPSTLTAVSAVNGYTWSPAAPNASLIVINPTSNVVYTVTASDGTCSGTSTVGITTKVTPTITATSNQSVFCDGGSAILSASGANTYVWSPGNQAGATVTVSPNVSTPYQVFGTNAVGCVGVANVVIIVNANPTITAVTSKTLVCETGSAVLNSNGASTYTWTGGTPGSQTYTVNPSTTTEYTITGTGQNGCTDQEVVTVNVYLPVLNISATPSAVCPGGLINLSASTHGGSNFKWNGNTAPAAIQVAPASSTVFVASANSNSNSVICPASNSIQLTVHSNPTVTASADKTVLCRNEKAPVITAGGASTYAWSNGPATTNTIAAANNISNSYVVTGTDANGCVGTATVAITVNPCTGLTEASANDVIQIYPNPSKGTFMVSTTQDVTLTLINELGQVLKTLKLSADNDHSVSVENLPAGIYFVVGETSTSRINQKIVIAN